MATFEYELDEHVALVTMNSGENRFNFEFFKAFSETLDKIEHDTDAGVLVAKHERNSRQLSERGRIQVAVRVRGNQWEVGLGQRGHQRVGTAIAPHVHPTLRAFGNSTGGNEWLVALQHVDRGHAERVA